MFGFLKRLNVLNFYWAHLLVILWIIILYFGKVQQVLKHGCDKDAHTCGNTKKECFTIVVICHTWRNHYIHKTVSNCDLAVVTNAAIFVMCRTDIWEFHKNTGFQVSQNTNGVVSLFESVTYIEDSIITEISFSITNFSPPSIKTHTQLHVDPDSITWCISYSVMNGRLVCRTGAVLKTYRSRVRASSRNLYMTFNVQQIRYYAISDGGKCYFN